MDPTEAVMEAYELLTDNGDIDALKDTDETFLELYTIATRALRDLRDHLIGEVDL